MSKVIFLAGDRIAIENVKIRYRDFQGTKFGEGGKKNFTIIIDDADDAERLKELGYSVVEKQVYEHPERTEFQLKIQVSFKYGVPCMKIYGVNTRIVEDENDVIGLGMFDKSRLSNVNIQFYHGKPWTLRDGRSGVTAYLSSIRATLSSDDYFSYMDEPRSESSVLEKDCSIDENAPF